METEQEMIPEFNRRSSMESSTSVSPVPLGVQPHVAESPMVVLGIEIGDGRVGEVPVFESGYDEYFTPGLVFNWVSTEIWSYVLVQLAQRFCIRHDISEEVARPLSKYIRTTIDDFLKTKKRR